MLRMLALPERTQQHRHVLIMPTAIIHGVFDESGKFQDHDAISLCGWIAPLNRWEYFASDWNNALRLSEIDELHTAEFIGLHGQYSRIRNKWGAQKIAKRDKALDRFTRVIREHVGTGLGTVIDTKHYRSMSQSFRKRVGEDPYLIAFQDIIRQAMKYVKAFAQVNNLGDKVALALIFDQDEQQATECLRLLNKIKKNNPDIRKIISGICFCNRRGYLPLQAADFVAYEARQELDRKINHPHKPISPRFDALCSRNPAGFPDGMFNARLFDAEILNELEQKCAAGLDG